jgi:hypothetical protein
MVVLVGTLSGGKFTLPWTYKHWNFSFLRQTDVGLLQWATETGRSRYARITKSWGGPVTTMAQSFVRNNLLTSEINHKCLLRFSITRLCLI